MENVFNREGFSILDDISGRPGEDGKTDIVKRIELIDVHNISREDVEFMLTTVQDSLKADKYADRELIEQIPEHITLLAREEYVSKMMELDESKTVEDAEDLSGFYNEELEQMFVNQDFYDTPKELFATVLHESLHCVSIRAGAGYGGKFSYSVDIEEGSDVVAIIKDGIETLAEGTTQEMTWEKMRGMGFEDKEDYGYIPQMRVMRAIYSHLSKDEMMKLYYKTSIEEIRVHFDEVFGGERGEALLGCLYNVGVAAENMEIAVDFEDEDDEKSIKEDIGRAMEYYFKKLKEGNV